MIYGSLPNADGTRRSACPISPLIRPGFAAESGAFFFYN